MSGGSAKAADAHRRQRHVEQVPAVHVELGAELVQLGEQSLGLLDIQARDLNRQAGIMLVRALDHHDVAAALVGDQQHSQAQTGQRGSWPVGQVGQRRRGQPHRRQALADDQLLE
jgi:hypothetical protein